MKKIDLKSERSDLYRPPAKEVTEVDVPPMNYLMILGEGDPNTSDEYKAAVETLYSVSYALKFKIKKGPHGIDYAVMPLESLWWLPGSAEFIFDNKAAMQWAAMIVQPDQVTPQLYEETRAQITRKRLPALSRLRYETLHEGRAAQILHIGSWDEEAGSVEKLRRFIEDRGGRPRGRHHEIYLSDPRRTSPEKLRTIIRQPFA